MASAPVVHITPDNNKLIEAINKKDYAELEELLKLAKETAEAQLKLAKEAAAIAPPPQTGFAAFDKFITALQKENPNHEELIKLYNGLTIGTQAEKFTAGFYKAQQFVRRCDGMRSDFIRDATTVKIELKSSDSTVINVLERFAKVMGYQVTIDATHIHITWLTPKTN
jgi:hypothetical protein